MTQYAIPCSVYRGGTSRGLFFHESDLPKEFEKRRTIFTCGIDAYNLSQIDGLGSGTSHSSKVVVVGKEDHQITYTFYQVGIGTNVIDDKGTCGNLMAAVGSFAVNEQLVHVDPKDNYVNVLLFNTNVNMEVMITVPVKNGKAKVNGNYFMPGIVKSGAKYKVNMLHPGGSKTGHTFPLGRKSNISINNNDYLLSFSDIVNPFLFIHCHQFGLTGTETVKTLNENTALLNELNEIRDETAVKVGFARDRKEARTVSSAIPKIAIISEPQNYVTTSGKKVKKEDVDLLAKMLSMGQVHRTFAASGLYNLAATSLLSGTIPYDVANLSYKGKSQLVRIGHPDGIAHVRVSLTTNKKDVFSVGLNRTARLIMKGHLFVPQF